MESGKMLYEEEPNDGGLVHDAMNTNMTYDPEHNIFYTFTTDVENVKSYIITIKNFKKAE
jgi:hypothetical protein